ncbi:MAG: 3-dehydroquinate synthase [Desulfobacteraceae bacterium]|nr:MAG: 3-dehydroquinate synthase [Desulfobacteraceae bacterium]
MKRIDIQGTTRRSSIYIGESLKNLARYIPSRDVVLITDDRVSHYYKHDFPQFRTITIGTGERIKTMETAADIYQELLAMNAQRSTFLVGIGGGIVCDITGFVASTFLRGVPFGFVSSTLLSQVDASVGGKNGVNFQGFKNMVGVFNQPEFVICDPDLLQTLPERELLCGFAEVVKHAVIEDPELFAFMENNTSEALALNRQVIERFVHDSVVIKSTIVNRDEKEKGERRKLNFGHTFGHAIEKTTGIPHGEAVSIGMVFAAALSVRKAMLSEEEFHRIIRLLNNFKLPTSLDHDKQQVMDALKKDKKREGDHIHFVLLHRIGKSAVEKIAISELGRIIDIT